MSARPTPDFFAAMNAMLQKKLAQSMSRRPKIGSYRFTCSNQIAERLVFLIGNPDSRQFASAVTSRQFQRIQSICLHPVSGFFGNERRSDYFAIHTEANELPI
jgi:hypothetical protein